uniref:Uncharacterized protein n=1 Tax=Cucumis sativus TaxID=3659 RepID=A0A0A0KFH7_CUCSA
MEVSVLNGWAEVSKRLTSRAARPLGWADVVDDNGSKRSELWTSGGRGFRRRQRQWKQAVGVVDGRRQRVSVCVGVSNGFFRMEVSVSNEWVRVSKRLTSRAGFFGVGRCRRRQWKQADEEVDGRRHRVSVCGRVSNGVRIFK